LIGKARDGREDASEGGENLQKRNCKKTSEGKRDSGKGPRRFSRKKGQEGFSEGDNHSRTTLEEKRGKKDKGALGSREGGRMTGEGKKE